VETRTSGSAGGHGKRTRGNPDTAPVPDLTASTQRRSCLACGVHRSPLVSGMCSILEPRRAANSTGCAMHWNQGAGVQRAIQSKGPVPLDDWTRWWAWVLGADSAGNSNGDVPMLEFTQHSDKPTLRLLLHDDAEREFDYTTAPNRHSGEPRPTDGPSPVSRTTGPPSLTSTRPASRMLHGWPRAQARRTDGRQRRLCNVGSNPK
jgi:hypothetical protein